MAGLDDPSRMDEIRAAITRKPALRHFYRAAYEKFLDCLGRCPEEGEVLELGSGAGFAKSVIPSLITSDIIPYPGIDEVIDAGALPFADESLRMICMINVFHHIPDVELFLREAQRCLVPGGRIFMVDQNVGPVSFPVLKYLHHEPFDPSCGSWRFVGTGPLSGANGALAWVVFRRDRAKFAELFPRLKIERVEPHTPFLYWLAGGLKWWNLAPKPLLPFVVMLDNALSRLDRRLGSFLDVEIRKERG